MHDTRTTGPLTVALVALALGAAGCSGPARTAPAADGPHRATGPAASSEDSTEVDLRARITAFAEGLAADAVYRGPTRAERRKVSDGVGHALDGRTGRAGETLSAVGYGIRVLRDRGTGLRVAEIADGSAGSGGSRRGWGRVYVRLDGAPRWSVQVPHPAADLHTERLGVGVLLSEAPGGVLVIAGAHREAGEDGSADVAHREDTVFHAVCDELTERGLPALQVHGFADDSLPGEDAIVSTGAGDEARRRARRLAEELEDRGLEVCRAWERDCGALEGRTNVQGEEADAEDVPFLHLEFSRRVRDDEDRRRSAVEAMTGVAEEWSDPADADDSD